MNRALYQVIYGVDSTPYPEGQNPNVMTTMGPTDPLAGFDPEELAEMDPEELLELIQNNGGTMPDSMYDYYSGPSVGQNFTANINDEFDFKLNQTDKVSSMRVKFLDYFDYAIVDVKNKNITRDELAREGCIDECGTGEWA